MAKQLKDILKAAHDTIKGVKASTTTAGSTGKTPGVDYDPKASDEREFIAKHSVQRWDEPAGNKNQADVVKYSLDTPQNARMGNKQKEAEKAYFAPVKEAKKMKCESCNSMYEGTSCGCGAKPVKKLEEVLTKKTSAGVVIGDFQRSKDKRFAGKTKEERTRMALGAYYSMHPEKSKKANEEVDLEEGITTGNEGNGYHGNVEAGSHEERGKKYAAMHSKVKKLVGSAGHLKDAKKPNEMVKHFLDSSHGRHIADDPSDKNVTGRFSHFKKTYNPKQHTSERIKEDLAVPLLQGEDESAEMAKTELKALANKAMHLVTQIPDSMMIEPWVQSKIAQAKSMINDVHDYMLYSDKDKEDEQAETPLTFPNMSVDVNTGQNV